jgi:hypothetical protein
MFFITYYMAINLHYANCMLYSIFLFIRQIIKNPKYILIDKIIFSFIEIHIHDSLKKYNTNSILQIL